MTPSKILFYFCLSFIGGIFLSSIEWNFFSFWAFFAFGTLILGVLVISLFWKSRKLITFIFCLLFFMIGIYRHRIAASKIEENLLKKYWGQNIAMIGIIDAEPEKGEKTTKFPIIIKMVQCNEERHCYIEGRILITKWHYPEFEYGDRLKIRGKLDEPQVFEDFNYKNYLAKDGIFALMYQPEIELIGKNKGNPLKKFLISIKKKLNVSLNKTLPFPQAPFLEALLFGEEGNISESWKEKLNRTGTRHIAAVSGMNITILTLLISDFFLGLGFWRSQSFYFSLILIFLYILMIGAPSSALRAGIMATLFLTAQQFGRVSTGSRAVILAATVMLAINPLLLLSDVGFQLSFLAVMGLIYLQPTLFSLFRTIPNFLEIRYNLSGTLAAQIFTFPLLIYNFGQISAISPISNILILPFLPIITIFGFIFSALGVSSGILGWLLSWPTYFLLAYTTKIIDFFSRIPLANLNFENLGSIWLLGFYFLLGLGVWRLQENRKLKFLRY